MIDLATSWSGALAEPKLSKVALEVQESPTRDGLITGGLGVLVRERRPVGILSIGDVFKANSYPYIALKPLGLLRLNEADVDESAYARVLVRSTSRHASRLATSSICRVADLVLELAEKTFDAAPLAHITLTTTQSVIGGLLGISTVHTNRTLRKLMADRVIAYGDGYITILDRESLERLSKDVDGGASYF